MLAASVSDDSTVDEPEAPTAVFTLAVGVCNALNTRSADLYEALLDSAVPA